MVTTAMQILMVLAWLGLVGAIAEGLRRYTPVGTEVTRKVVHIGAGQVILLAWWLDTPTWMGVTASLIFSGVALISYHYPILPGINGVGRHSLGTFFYALSMGLLTLAFWPPKLPQFASLGILTMTWGDGLAALGGQRFGRHPYRVLGSQKSWEGSLIMAVATFLTCLGVLSGASGWSGQVLITAVLVAIAATALETLSFYGFDNLTVPLGSAVLAYWLMG
ncbi:MAG: SEC59/DGK1/VTE5 family protein [Cyanobacteria bacterium REEB459]|nr:SEC59/DGK1/VTE5 family protein [Cyanobacteria bacterium REEB459]